MHKEVPHPYFKRKAAGKRGFWKKDDRDWLVVILSLVSLTIAFGSFVGSALTIYLTQFRHLDEVSVVVDDAPRFDVDLTDMRGKLSGELSLFVINTGNRPVGILRVVIEAGDPRGFSKEDQHCLGTRFDMEGDGFVVKEREITFKRLTFRPWSVHVGRVKIEDDRSMTFPVGKSGAKEFAGNVCVNFQLSTPAKASVWKTVELYRITRKAGETGSGGYESKSRLEPITLIKE